MSYVIDKEIHFPFSFHIGGCRQGDPLPPFFSHWWPMPSQILKNKENRNLVQGFRVCKDSVPLSHLRYANDTLLFLDGEKTHLLNLISLIHCFELVSGMKIIGKRASELTNSNLDEYNDIPEALECQICTLLIII